jgi:hypothetical protein
LSKPTIFAGSGNGRHVHALIRRVASTLRGNTAMLGLLAALIAIYLGAAGPRFRWKGASWLAAAAVTIGVVATMMAASGARSMGADFAVTPASLVLGLLLQAIFMLTFYGLSMLARWSWRGLTRDPDEIPPAED